MVWLRHSQHTNRQRDNSLASRWRIISLLVEHGDTKISSKSIPLRFSNILIAKIASQDMKSSFPSSQSYNDRQAFHCILQVYFT